MTKALVSPRRAVGFAVLGLLGACASLPPVPEARLPEASGGGQLLDPARQAILHASSAFGSAAPMAGRPWEAAQAISEAEFLAVELRHNSRWTEMPAIVSVSFEQARPEWRAALGIDPAASAQSVIDAMTRVRLAFGAQDPVAAGAALGQAPFGLGGPQTLDRLSALPALPRTAQATSLAERGLWSMQRRDGRSLGILQ